ncbi:hypothetical protein N480_25480 [Pseudoalteromonas luteoviolacea S2607]|uniref:aspartyl/asparaginyl beta-hydroxylase domain-containing protein n=1 Tax=Pseudoalteromonas luteoviolacea TaxID=43657 RepID=UPI0007B04FC7|nr:aspartyl/asparaginyl beta-hydroxylase domain-containing protein [Pseudoalteromonas luteoviolacea]KZN32604.1 hypothetical protein N480_25480 [Pseudoalteromonas luteoviolacea S2607]
MKHKLDSIKELFPSSLQKVDKILWTGKSELERLCSLQDLSHSHVTVQANGNLPEIGTQGIIWFPYFRIFPGVVCARTETTFTVKFENLDSLMKKDLDYFLRARETGVEKPRPGVIARGLLRTVYEVEKRLPGIEHRTFSPEDFPWSLDFEKNYTAIRSEVDNIFSHVNVDSIPLGIDQVPNAHSVLVAQQGQVEPSAEKLLPTISRLVANVPLLANAELSILAPGAELRLHKAKSRCFLRMHLGIIIPKGDVCLELEWERLEWKEGKVMIFDDFYPHRAWNKTEHTRVILMVDLFRPMNKWQAKFFRFAQRRIVPSIPKIPEEWLSW